MKQEFTITVMTTGGNLTATGLQKLIKGALKDEVATNRVFVRNTFSEKEKTK